MVKKKLRILSRIFTVLYLVLSCVVFSCNNYDCRDNRLIVSTGIDPENNIDTVYFLIDNSSRDVIYYAGWDPIEENFVTEEYQIFIEENIMQELDIEADECFEVVLDKEIVFIKNRKVVYHDAWHKKLDIHGYLYPEGLVFFAGDCFYTNKENAKFKAKKNEPGYLILEKIE